MSQPSARDQFTGILRTSVNDGSLVKLTLGNYRGADPTLRNLFVRPVALKAGPHLSFVWRHATQDITKNHPPGEALPVLESLIGGDFLDAHLFTPAETIQLSRSGDRTDHLSRKLASEAPPPAVVHDREKHHLIPSDSPWLHPLGVTNEQGRPREGQAAKFRQINKFAELLRHLLLEAGLDADGDSTGALDRPLRIFDMGCGKGYLTFAVSSLLGERALVHGIEARPELVALCLEVALRHNFIPRLSFTAGTITDASVPAADVLIALHACDTATDDALARGHAAGAKLIVVAPCCHKELRSQLTAPPVLAEALRHGIFQERQAEFVTDALRSALLEWAGYRTKVFEFIATEHTAKNLMIAAIKTRQPGAADDVLAERIRALARFYGIRSQALARHLEFSF